MSLSTLNYLPLPPTQIKRNMYFGEFKESRTGSNIIFRGWDGEDVEWAGRKGRSCTGLPLAFIIMSSDPNLYSMASGTLWNTYYIFHKEKHLPWLQVMMLIISGNFLWLGLCLTFQFQFQLFPTLVTPNSLCLGCLFSTWKALLTLPLLVVQGTVVPRNLSKLSKPKPRDQVPSPLPAPVHLIIIISLLYSNYLLICWSTPWDSSSSEGLPFFNFWCTDIQYRFWPTSTP